MGNTENENLTISQTQAKFVNLDGRVQVKKVNSVTWVDADYHTALDKGDLIQTGSDGAARMTFADGTEYTVKAESMVTVEENNVTESSPTRQCASTPDKLTWRRQTGHLLIRRRQ